MLSYFRWLLILCTIEALSMVTVSVRTYKNSKFPYLYTCAIMMFLASMFKLIATILANWKVGCGVYYDENEKCHGEPSQDWEANIALF